MIDAQDNRTETVYDSQGRQVIRRDPTGAEEITQYDALGRVLSQTDAAGGVTTYEYTTPSAA